MVRSKSARKRLKKKSAARRSRRRAPRRGPATRTTEAALAAFAHDFRTSLTGILALGELLASSNLGERERRWAAGIKTGAEHLAALTTLAIDAAKIDSTRPGAGALTLRQQAFRPRRLIEALADTLSARAETKGLTVDVTVAADLPEMLVGDPARLRAAIENLIDNAVKFTERGSVRLDVGASQAGRGKTKLVCTVTDSGIGLTRAEIKRLFRPFTQANAEIARRYGGAGLGLAVVKSLAKLMGGDLTVASTPGRGSTFRLAIVLPIATADTSGSPHAQPTKTPSRRLAVLCVEDNPYGRVILNTILTELGHRADFVASGEEAVEAVKRGYDVVLMDVTLPGIDGLEATRRIRALADASSRTPIIGISGRTETGDEEAARAAGMDSYLRKPVSPSALSEAIEAILPSS
jgi:CheY-like chemotaxis protein/nitrogen-specific signal transduction histidine kinase